MREADAFQYSWFDLNGRLTKQKAGNAGSEKIGKFEAKINGADASKLKTISM